MQDSLFEDGKDPQAFRTIGEVSAALDIKPHVLRYWEEQFPMLRPVKRSGGRRYYRPADVALLQTIDRLLNHDGYTIRGAVKAIADGAAAPAAPPPPPAPDAHSPVISQADAAPGDLAPSLPGLQSVTPYMVERLRDAVRTLEASTGDLPPAAPNSGGSDSVDLVRMQGRLRALRERLASALDA